ncbi:MAG TPA: decaprenyl-phosphate phosphoribosyltransferase [Gammaproteobacteria bacterium]|nr:decaprenyl-phosphate phosphoribosyltransferase [Gammaproteobacteria bacterium]
MSSFASWTRYIRLFRPKQWVKNSFVLTPLLFSGYFHPLPISKALFATLLFSLASSSVYIFNDIIDRHSDALHPQKSHTRPIAAGQISVRQASYLLAITLGLLFTAGLRQLSVLTVIGIYLLLNLAYSLRLKRVPVVDIFIISSGFVLRVYAGAVALDAPVSPWMFITTLSLALFLAAIKRRQELLDTGSETRAVLNRYTQTLIENYALMAATSTLVFYSLFVVSTRQELMITIPFVMFGIFRYWYIVVVDGQGESPTDVLFSDLPLQLTLLGWTIGCVIVIWPSQLSAVIAAELY